MSEILPLRINLTELPVEQVIAEELRQALEAQEHQCAHTLHVLTLNELFIAFIKNMFDQFPVFEQDRQLQDAWLGMQLQLLSLDIQDDKLSVCSQLLFVVQRVEGANVVRVDCVEDRAEAPVNVFLHIRLPVINLSYESLVDLEIGIFILYLLNVRSEVAHCFFGVDFTALKVIKVTVTPKIVQN